MWRGLLAHLLRTFFLYGVCLVSLLPLVPGLGFGWAFAPEWTVRRSVRCRTVAWLVLRESEGKRNKKMSDAWLNCLGPKLEAWVFG